MGSQRIGSQSLNKHGFQSLNLKRPTHPSRLRLQSAKPSSQLPFKSTLIEIELQEIQRFRAKQQREIEALLQNEKLLEEKRLKNIERELAE